MPSLRGAGSHLRAARETKKLPAGDRSSGTVRVGLLRPTTVVNSPG